MRKPYPGMSLSPLRHILLLPVYYPASSRLNNEIRRLAKTNASGSKITTITNDVNNISIIFQNGHTKDKSPTILIYSKF